MLSIFLVLSTTASLSQVVRIIIIFPPDKGQVLVSFWPSHISSPRYIQNFSSWISCCSTTDLHLSTKIISLKHLGKQSCLVRLSPCTRSWWDFILAGRRAMHKYDRFCPHSYLGHRIWLIGALILVKRTIASLSIPSMKRSTLIMMWPFRNS